MPEEETAAVGRYDEEDDVCTGCGALVSDEHEWCPECAPEVHA